jgi:hypothetical protein
VSRCDPQGQSFHRWRDAQGLVVGISSAVNRPLILAAGIYQLLYPPANPGTVIFQLHANMWWGALLLAIGAVYCFLFAPRRQV